MQEDAIRRRNRSVKHFTTSGPSLLIITCRARRIELGKHTFVRSRPRRTEIRAHTSRRVCCLWHRTPLSPSILLQTLSPLVNPTFSSSSLPRARGCFRGALPENDQNGQTEPGIISYCPGRDTQHPAAFHLFERCESERGFRDSCPTGGDADVVGEWMGERYSGEAREAHCPLDATSRSGA